MRYRAALIGCGYIGSLYANDPKIKGIYTHAGAYTACSKTELVAVCDIDEAKAITCAKKWNVSEHYVSIEKMLLEQNPEIISICTSDKTHADILNLILNKPGVRGIVVEKPLALDVNQAVCLVQMAKKKHIPLIVNYNRRYSNGHQKIKKLIDNGLIGKIQKVSGYYTKGILHNGTHWLDLARWFIGEIETGQGFASAQPLELDPCIDVILKFKNGATGFLQNLDGDKYSLFEMDILGILGRIKIINSGHQIEFFNVQESKYYSGYKTVQKYRQMKDNVSDTLLNVVEDMVSCVENDVKPRSSGEDGLVTLQIAHALISSIKDVVCQNHYMKVF